ncbi:hypothetical protein ABMA28_000345 [Loxostege sticticalis]|uniref:Zinc finger BED domain-containing protein 5 n=1 Tax=Loxostege sticticalis TaxID=481309 RepID=A0ABD0TRX0_LOXSC
MPKKRYFDMIYRYPCPSDGARAMSGIRTGLYPRVKVVAPECVWTHCSIHREALAVKKMPLPLTTTMQECVKFVNFIKSRPLNSILFSVLCNEMGSDHEHLLLLCEVRWLSRDNLNMALQGNNVTIFKVHDKVEAARKKLNVYNLSEIQKECNMAALPQDILTQIKEHLLGLERNLQEYFPPIDSNKAWIRNPFTFKLDSETNLPDSDVDSLIELSTDTALKDIFDTRPLIDFWLSCRQEYTKLAHQAITFLMPFVTTYKCEAGFSTLVCLKNK